MAWKISYRESFLRAYKKLSKNIRDEILQIADKIQSGDDGKLLKHSWDSFYSWHFGRNAGI